MMDTRIYWIWLQQHLPLNCLAADALLRRFGSAEEIYKATPAALKEIGLDDKKIERLQDKSLVRATRTLKAATRGLDWVLTPDDAWYPERLRRIDGFPLVLYCRGELPDWKLHPFVGVVGTRHATPSGLANAYSLCAGLAAGGAVVVSGGAVGIDGQAHRGCLSVGGKTVLAKPDRLDGGYLQEHAALRDEIVRSGGLLVSEFAPDEDNVKFDFHVRNRLISGLSDAVCLVETPVRSGALITANLAREQGRDVFAMPGDVPSHCNDGSHKLIREGAMLVTRAGNILEELAPWYPVDLDAAAIAENRLPAAVPAPPVPPKRRRGKVPTAPETAPTPAVKPEPRTPQLPVSCPDTVSAAAKTVYGVLAVSPRPLNLIAETADLPVPTVLVALTELELCGCAVSAPGGAYQLRTQSSC